MAAQSLKKLFVNISKTKMYTFVFDSSVCLCMLTNKATTFLKTDHTRKYRSVVKDSKANDNAGQLYELLHNGFWAINDVKNVLKIFMENFFEFQFDTYS